MKATTIVIHTNLSLIGRLLDITVVNNARREAEETAARRLDYALAASVRRSGGEKMKTQLVARQ